VILESRKINVMIYQLDRKENFQSRDFFLLSFNLTPIAFSAIYPPQLAAQKYIDIFLPVLIFILTNGIVVSWLVIVYTEAAVTG
jgi:hypothetical protein